ncbi:MAG: GAF domain-containing protein [Candidatus Thermoplasmatota archaeon]|nr:GAF domain-containing protein [Candidatus Thermoplasmatota archaeon]
MKRVLERVRETVEKDQETKSKLKDICMILHDELKGYDWVGFYLVENGELVLGPYVGKPTEHTNIDFGEGICGQAADREETFLIDDVKREQNYLSCSPKVESEIVVPIFKEGDVVGEIDIDSHQRSRFGDEDEKLLEEIAEMVGKIL